MGSPARKSPEQITDGERRYTKIPKKKSQKLKGAQLYNPLPVISKTAIKSSSKYFISEGPQQFSAPFAKFTFFKLSRIDQLITEIRE